MSDDNIIHSVLILHSEVCYNFIHAASGDVYHSANSIRPFSVSVGNPYSENFTACYNCLFHLTAWKERENAVFQELCRYSGSEREWLTHLM